MADNSFFQGILDWWNTLDGITKAYWVIAIPATLIFLIQMMLLMFGFDADDADAGGGDMDADGGVDGDSGFQLFTVRNLVIFLTVFSWSGISFSESGFVTGVTMAISFVIAIAVMLFVAWMFKKISTLGENGTFKISKAVGCTGTVYIPIPSKGRGKVQAKVDGRLVELEATTDSQEDLATGAIVEITEVINNQIVKVKAS